MNRTRILALAAATLLAACNGLMSNPVPADVVYQADHSEYTPQDYIVTTLVNTSDAEVGYNLCGAAVELRTRGGWTRVARNPEQPCIQPLYILRPGESATHREPAGHFPGPGTYRLRTRVETPVPGPATYAVTAPFTVRE